jgi:hypothetical protein
MTTKPTLTPGLRDDVRAIALTEIMDAARRVTDDDEITDADREALLDAAVALQAVIDLPGGHPALVSVMAERDKPLEREVENAIRSIARRHAETFATWIEHRGHDVEVERAWRVLRALSWDAAEPMLS